MIKSRHPGEWYCTECDAREDERGTTWISWTRSAAPKVCWRCIVKDWCTGRDVADAAHAIAEALLACGGTDLRGDDLRLSLSCKGVVVDGVSPGRFSAMVRRYLAGNPPTHFQRYFS